MSQEKPSRQGSQIRTNTASRSSSATRTTPNESRAPSPDPYPQKQDSNHESLDSEDESTSADSTSLLGSMWNLVRDARDLAAKELDKLLEHFPYKNTSSEKDQTLSIKKPAPKSFLGHGPLVKQRSHNSKRKPHSFTKMLLDEDFKDHVNYITPQNQYKALSSRSRITSRDHQEKSTRNSHHYSGANTVQREHLQQRKRISSLKRELSQSSLADRYGSIREPEDWGSTSESQSQYNGEDTDTSEYFQVGSRRVRMSRENSPTPSIASITGNMTISGISRPRNHQHHQSHSRQGSHSHSRQSSHTTSRVRFPRYSLLGEPLDEQGYSPTPPPIYVEFSQNHKEPSVYRKSPSPPYPTVIVDEEYNPFLDSRESSPLPSSSHGVSPELNQRTSNKTNLAENDKLNELQQELAEIKQQLASLVSARKEDMERVHSSPAQIDGSIAPPPPPPPPPSLITPKKWSPPHSAASLSMQNVLKELSSSKVQLRKTGSPFISRISSAVETSPSSKYTSLSIKSKDEIDKHDDDDSDSYPRSPLANIKRPLKMPQAIRNKPLAKEIESSVEADLGISWPSSKTLEEADSRLDKAAKKIANTNSVDPEPQLSETSRLVSRTSSAPEGKRKWTKINTLGASNIPVADQLSQSPKQSPLSIFDFSSQDHPKAESKLSGNKKPRPTKPQIPTLHRSMTDPIQSTKYIKALSSTQNADVAKRVSFQSPANNNEHERLWFLESDTDNWRVSN